TRTTASASAPRFGMWFSAPSRRNPERSAEFGPSDPPDRGPVFVPADLHLSTYTVAVEALAAVGNRFRRILETVQDITLFCVPVLTGMVVASRMSAGITAELGAMRSSDQIDALVAFGTDPLKRLVAPRMIALWIALPILTIVGDALSVIGGAFIGLGYHITFQ